jgi:hypothetical protein
VNATLLEESGRPLTAQALGKTPSAAPSIENRTGLPARSVNARLTPSDGGHFVAVERNAKVSPFAGCRFSNRGVPLRLLCNESPRSTPAPGTIGL